MTCPGASTYMKGGSKKRTMRKRSKNMRRKTRNTRRRMGRRSKKGGFMGGIIEQALVPFGLFALQKKMQNRKKTTKRKSKK
tara:strand:+ start:4812 stop:5054 length:243 start_codon:yes stop_codon:yes gene_type:complete